MMEIKYIGYKFKQLICFYRNLINDIDNKVKLEFYVIIKVDLYV